MFFKKDVSIVVGDSPLINAISSPPKLVNQSLQSVGTLVRVLMPPSDPLGVSDHNIFHAQKKSAGMKRNQHPTKK